MRYDVPGSDKLRNGYPGWQRRQAIHLTLYISFFWCGQRRERERIKKICRERKNLLFSKSVLTPQLFNSNPTTIVITNYLLLLKKTSRCFNVGTVTSSSDLCYTSRTDEHADANCRRYDLPFRKAVEKEKEKKRRGLIVIFPTVNDADSRSCSTSATVYNYTV